MGYDINSLHLSGTVEQIKPIQTRSGIAMTSFVVRSYKEQIRCVAFREIANALVQSYKAGDRIELRGRLQQNNYERDGTKYYTYQVNTTDLVEAGQEPEQVPEPEQQVRPGLENIDYAGGPF